MNRSRAASLSLPISFVFNLVGVLALAGLLFAGLAPQSRASAAPLAAVQRPSLTGGFDSAGNGRVTLNGAHFTPGGLVYLAIYDQAGQRLYENRMVLGGPSIATQEAEAMNGSYHMPVVDEGTFSETFNGLCGASAMARAFDESTKTWSEFLTLNANCATAAETADDLNGELSLPVAEPKFSASGLVDPPLLLAASNGGDSGAISITGFAFTPNQRVYVAIYDQMGAKLYANRWVRTTAYTHVLGMSNYAPELNSTVTLSTEGVFHVSLAHYCGSNVMIRAYDQGTRTWSNWINLPADCAGSDASSAKIG